MQSFSTWDKRQEYTISPFNPYVTVQKINDLSSVPSGRIPYLLCLKSVIQSNPKKYSRRNKVQISWQRYK